MTTNNFIIDSLPWEDYKPFAHKLKEVNLEQGTILHHSKEQIDWVFFPVTCVLAWVNSTEAGELIESGMTGSEGVSGVTLLLNESVVPWRTEVQIPGKALKLSAADFMDALDQSTALRQSVAAFTYLKMVQLSQAAVCNRFHTVSERLCRWLLEAQDHSGRSEISLTRDTMAHMIGAGRPSVSLATGILQNAGLIHADRGRISILGREGMEEMSCECYRIYRDALDRYFARKKD